MRSLGSVVYQHIHQLMWLVFIELCFSESMCAPAQGPPAAAAAEAAPAEPTAAVDDKKAKKKDRKGGAAGVVLGKGTAILRAAVEAAAAG